MDLSKIGNKVADAVQDGIKHSIIGYLSCRAFTHLNVNPMFGLAYGASFATAGLVLGPIFCGASSNMKSKILGAALISSIAAAAAIKTLGLALNQQTLLKVCAACIAGKLLYRLAYDICLIAYEAVGFTVPEWLES